MSNVVFQPNVVLRSFSETPPTFQLPARKAGEGNAAYLARASMKSYADAGNDVANAVASAVNAFPVAEVEAILALPAGLRAIANGSKAKAYNAAADAIEKVIKESGAQVPVQTVRAIEDHAIADGYAAKSKAELGKMDAQLRDSGLRLVKGVGFTVVDAGAAVGHAVQGTALLVGAGACVIADGCQYLLHALYEGAKCVGVVACKIAKDVEKGAEIVADETKKAVVFVGEEAVKAAKAIEKGAEIAAKEVVKAGECVVREVKDCAEATKEAACDVAHNAGVLGRKATEVAAVGVRDDAINVAIAANHVAVEARKGDNTLRDPFVRGK